MLSVSRKARKMAGTYQRVLVHLQGKKDKEPKQAHFTQSILDKFDCEGDVMSLYGSMKGDKLLLKDTPINKGDSPVKMKRPSFCPIHQMSEAQRKQLPRESSERGVDVGAAVILESCDGKVLLIRRAAHLRTFPGIWVPAGGHVEVDETLYEAALRELHEESGLEVTPVQCDELVCKNYMLALWESVFPPKLSSGLPKRHHVVTYVHAKLKPPLTAEVMEKRLNLDPEEVGAAAWFDKDMVKLCIDADEESDTTSSAGANQDTFRVITVDRSGRHSTDNTSLSVLTAVHSGQKEDGERISTGTKFALAEWLQRTK